MEPTLSKHHAEVLDHISSDSPNPAFRRRAKLLLLLNKGNTPQDVSAQVGLATTTVHRWRRAFLKDGLGIFPGYSHNGNGTAVSKTKAPTKKKKSTTEESLKKTKKRLLKLKKAGKKKPIKKYIKQLKRRRSTLKKMISEKKSGERKALKSHLKSMNNHLKKARKILSSLK